MHLRTPRKLSSNRIAYIRFYFHNNKILNFNGVLVHLQSLFIMSQSRSTIFKGTNKLCKLMLQHSKSLRIILVSNIRWQSNLNTFTRNSQGNLRWQRLKNYHYNPSKGTNYSFKIKSSQGRLQQNQGVIKLKCVGWDLNQRAMQNQLQMSKRACQLRILKTMRVPRKPRNLQFGRQQNVFYLK